MAKKKKAGMTAMSWIMLAVMAVGLVLCVVGICTDWVTTKGEALGGMFSADGSSTLQDLKDASMPEDASNYFGLAFTCALVTLIAVAAAFACFLVGGLLKMKLLKTIGMIGGIVAVVAGIMAAIFTYLFGKEYSGGVDGLLSATTTLAYGAYLLLAGGIVGGIGAVVGGTNK